MDKKYEYNSPLVYQRADPFVYLHTDGYYYFTGTMPQYDCIEIRRAKTLNGLLTADSEVVWKKHPTGEMGSHIWAPELHYIDGVWYIYFTAGDAKDVWEIRPYLLMCEDENPMTGKWIEKGRIDVGVESFSLDMTTFIHKGEQYVLWAQKTEPADVSDVYIAKMKNPWTLATKPMIITTPEYDWEVQGFKVNEGPAVLVRNGKVIGRESYKIDNTQHSTNEEILTDFVKQFYQNSEFIPEEILTEYEVDDSEAIMKWLSGIRKRKVTIAMPKRGEKLHLVEMVRKNADIALGNYKIKVMKEREKNTVLDMMQEQLRIEKRPYRIEAYDISNIQGTDNVGAMVVFENGKPAKRKYRIFKIKSFEGADDYAAMREVIYRRFRHALEEEEQVEKGTLLKRNAKFLPLPDLILLDGGKGHLNVITELLDMIEVDIETFGMVKNDKHRTRGLVSKNGEIELSATSPVFKLITHIQDEVHDTAISYHRKLRGKINSELDKINGIGEKRRKALLTTFKTIDKIKEATLDELLNVKEMDSKSAQSVYDYFRRNSDV